MDSSFIFYATTFWGCFHLFWFHFTRYWWSLFHFYWLLICLLFCKILRSFISTILFGEYNLLSVSSFLLWDFDILVLCWLAIYFSFSNALINNKNEVTMLIIFWGCFRIILIHNKFIVCFFYECELLPNILNQFFCKALNYIHNIFKLVI